MPEGNEETYKEMYEMGERLMQMAKDGGYDPDSDTEEDSESYEESPTMETQSQGSDKVSAALKMFGK